jgi:iron complex outermembrane receptor protein
MLIVRAVLALAAGALVMLSSAVWARDIFIRDTQGPVAGAQISIKGQPGRFVTDSGGVARLPDLVAGPQVLEIATPSGRRFERTIAAGRDALTIDVGTPTAGPATLPPLQVSASPLSRGVDDIATPATVLAGGRLDERRQASLGETVKDLPGIASSQFGPGASRPVIRGFDGPRVRVLADGVDALDAASVSPDHAVTSEPFLARQIEILKGPATLLYGGGAIGGVVNVIDGRVPTAVPARGYEGEGELRRNFNSDEMTGALGVTVGHKNVALRLEGALRLSDDYFAARAFGDPASRRVRNSFNDTRSLSVGASWIGGWGYFGVAASDQRNEYGLPNEEDVFIRLHSQRIDARGEWREPVSGIEKVRVRLGHVIYQHKEIEGDAVATTFKNTATDGRFEIVHNPIAGLRGVFGMQGLRRDFKAQGDEAYIPPTLTRNFGVFLLERYSWDSFYIEGGVRYEWQRINVRSDQPNRRHQGFSASLGAMWDFAPGFAVGLSFSRSQRLPTAEELYANGPHIATGQFEIGDPGLKVETSHNLELSLRKKTGAFQFGVSLYRNWVRNFIFQADTGAVIDDLRVVNFVQRNAVLHGFEAEATYAVTDYLDVSVFGDYVRAKLRRADDLPRIPPGRLGGRIDARWEGWKAYVQFYHVFAQDNVASFETRTPGYNMLNAGLAYGGELGPLTSYQVFLRVNNLLNEKARVHTSFIKDSVPLPGINVTLGARFTF